MSGVGMTSWDSWEVLHAEEMLAALSGLQESAYERRVQIHIDMLAIGAMS